MRTLLRAFFILAVLVTPLSVGCSSQLSEEETPIQSSDTDETESPVNDEDNP